MTHIADGMVEGGQFARISADAARRVEASSASVSDRHSRNFTSTHIADWANNTFGEPSSVMRVAARANEEMAELLRALSTDDRSPTAAEEAADVVIVLARVFTLLGTTMEKAVARKMGVNIARHWRRDGSGQGYHVRGGSVRTGPLVAGGCSVESNLDVGSDIPNGGAA